MQMQRAHIVYAHPEPKSFVGAMRDVVEDSLCCQGWHVTSSDLYAQSFNPVASGDDFGSRQDPDYLIYALEQRQGYKTGTLASDISREIALLRETDLLVMVFPIFWYSVPAILKGWIDRVFISGEFYGGKRIYARGGMVGKRALVVAALGGRNDMFGPDAIHGELSGMLRHLLQGTLGYVGYNVHEPFFAHHVPYLSNAEREQILANLRAKLAHIDSRATMPMPSLLEFDERFSRKKASEK
jgi:NAD(P)H dehydrogenase (quinone)